ncbi:MAG TPA: shikimate kinase [Armatimonadota bacterium]|jgi:shikimate kinase
MMGSGKSSVGIALAERLGWRFTDTDTAITETTGRTIPDIFATDGEEAFRDLESSAVRDAVRADQVVIATGGGAILRPRNREVLWSRCWVVWLAASLDEHCRRVQSSERRPVLDRYSDPVQGAGEVLAAREPFYASAHFTVDTTGLTVEAVVAAILDEWRELAP